MKTLLRLYVFVSLFLGALCAVQHAENSAIRASSLLRLDVPDTASVAGDTAAAAPAAASVMDIAAKESTISKSRAISVLAEIVHTLGNSSDVIVADSCDQDEDLSSPALVRNGGFLILLLIIYASLWGMYIVCEDYFVPALNRLCIEWRIPSDVAGATLMGMGNSAPELFTCAVSVFVVKSSLGAGTAIGSSLFNHLCICGVCAVIAKDGRVELDRRVLTREVLFYGLSLVMLLWAIKGSMLSGIMQLSDENQDNHCLKVHWYGAFMLMVLYVVYVLICAYYQRILDYFGLRSVYQPRSMTVCERIHYVVSGGRGAGSLESEWTVLRGLEEEDTKTAPLISNHPFTSPARSSPAGGDAQDQDNYTSLAHKMNRASPSPSAFDEELAEVGVLEEDDMEEDLIFGGGGDVVLDGGSSIATSATQGDSKVLGISERNSKKVTGAGTYHCWLLKYSDFYSKLRISSRKWQLRFFTLDDNGFRYCRTPNGPIEEVRYIDIFQASWISLGSGGGNSGTDASSPSSSPIEPMGIRHNVLRSVSTEGSALDSALGDPTTGAIDDDAFVFRVRTPSGTLTFRALTPEVYRRVTYLLQRRIAIYRSFPPPLRASLAELQTSRSHAPTRAPSGGAMRILTDLLNDSYQPRGPDDPGMDAGDDHDSYWDELALYYKAAAYISTAQHTRSPSASPMEAALGAIASPAAWVSALAAVNRIMGQLLRPLKFVIRRTTPYPEYPRGHKRAAARGNTDSDASSAADVASMSHIVRKNLLVVLVSSLWLGVLSYALTISLDLVAHAFGVSSAVTGLTVGAVAASFPTFLSSLIVAYQGEGDMAISNAFGSNVFGILVALGLPWFLSIIFELEGKPYDRLQDDGIVASAVISLLVLIMFYLMLVLSDFVLYRWMGYSFLISYLVYVIYALSVTL